MRSTKNLMTNALGVGGLAMGLLLLAAAPAGAAEIASMDLQFRNVNSDIDSRNPDFDFSGGLWYSNSDDVFGDHNLTSTNSDVPSGSPLDLFPSAQRGNPYTFAAQWAFSVTGSSGDDWDAVLASSSPVTFSASWDGELLEPNADVKEIFFSHIFPNGASAQASLDTWVENNNNAATPGGVLPEVWTYLSLSSLDPLTGATGVFGVVAHDPDDVMGLDGFFTQNQTDLAYVGTAGSGQITASVPEPATLGLLGIGLIGLGAARRRKRA